MTPAPPGRTATGSASRRLAVLRWPARLVSVTAALILAMLVTAGPALAHDVLISSDPAAGAVLSAAPASVSLTFDQPVQNFDPVLAVIGPNGNVFTTGKATISGDVVTAPMGPAGPAGAYRIVYRIVSADGHPVTGQLTYTLTAAGAGTATGATTAPPSNAAPSGTSPSGTVPGGAPADPGAPASGSPGIGVWLWVGIGVAAVLVVVAIGIALRKPRAR